MTYDGQQADEQQSAEHPGAVHGTGPGGGGRRSRRVRRQQIRTGGAQVAAGPQESLPPPPQLSRSYTESESPARGGHRCAGDGGRLLPHYDVHKRIQVKVAWLIREVRSETTWGARFRDVDVHELCISYKLIPQVSEVISTRRASSYAQLSEHGTLQDRLLEHVTRVCPWWE